MTEISGNRARYLAEISPQMIVAAQAACARGGDDDGGSLSAQLVRRIYVAMRATQDHPTPILRAPAERISPEYPEITAPMLWYGERAVEQYRYCGYDDDLARAVYIAMHAARFLPKDAWQRPSAESHIVELAKTERRLAESRRRP